MDYTLREIAGWTHFVNRIKKQEMAEQLSIGASAARGNPRDLKKQIKDLEKD